MMRIFAAAIIAVIAALSLAQQDKVPPKKQDGMELLRACRGPGDSSIAGQTPSGVYSDGLDYGYCFGVIRGVSFWLLPKGCANDVSMGQKALVVSKYLKDHPAKLNEPDALLVSVALSEAFPCPTSHIK